MSGEGFRDLNALDQNIGGELWAFSPQSQLTDPVDRSKFQTASFVTHTNKAFQGNPNYQFVQINLQENLLKSMLVSMFLKSLRLTIPEELHCTYLLSNQNMEYVRENMGLVNKHIGYVYLVDEQLKVRWVGCGNAMPEEAEALRTSVGVLLNRLDKTAKA